MFYLCYVIQAPLVLRTHEWMTRSLLQTLGMVLLLYLITEFYPAPYFGEIKNAQNPATCVSRHLASYLLFL